MNLTESDTATIYALLKDYQWFFEHAHDCYSFLGFMGPGMKAVDRPYREVREHIMDTSPMLLKVLSMDLPAGFSLLKTIDEQCLAWNGNERLGVHGPVSEFQARLWCWQHESFNDDIAHSLWLEEVQKITIPVIDEVVEEEEPLEGFREGLGGAYSVAPPQPWMSQ
jgi:hypothetical protein